MEKNIMLSESDWLFMLDITFNCDHIKRDILVVKSRENIRNKPIFMIETCNFIGD